MSKSNPKGFTLIEILITIAIIGFLASAILVSLSNAQIKAREAKYISFVSQISSLARKAGSSGAFDSIPATIPAGSGCLGIYTGSCWNNASYNNSNAQINNALQSIGTIPAGEYSPYYTANPQILGTIIRKTGANTIQITTYIGNFAYMNVCNKFGWPTVIPNALNPYCQTNITY